MPTLESLARTFFEDLTGAELKLLMATPTGRVTICGPDVELLDPANNPRDALQWGLDRQIRADLIRWICRDPRAHEYVDPKGIQVVGARILGTVDLSELNIPFRLALVRCRVTGEVVLRGVKIPLVSLDGSWVSAIKGDGANVAGGITLRKGFRAEQIVRFHRATIGADLDCNGGVFINPARKNLPETGIALAMDGANVGGGVFLNNGFHAEGEVRLPRAQIGGDLDCTLGSLHNGFDQSNGGSGAALTADGIRITGSVFLRGVQAMGEIRLARAKIGTDIDCVGGEITNPFRWVALGSASALNIEGSIVGGNVVCANGFHATGYVTMRGAQIRGQLICDQAFFENGPPLGAPISMPALDVSLADIASGAFLRFLRIDGEVRLQGTRIGTILDCEGSTFHNPPRANVGAAGYALTADGLKVSGRLAMGSGFSASGEVFMIGAEISGDLDCGGGQFNNPHILDTALGGRALSAHRVSVGGNAFVRSGFSASGDVSFQGAKIEGNLEGTSARFHGELSLESATVKGSLMLSDLAAHQHTRLTLTNATVGALADDAAGWPQRGNLLLDGFTYERFSGTAPKKSASRLRWLGLQAPFLPQPFRQLAQVLENEGEAKDSIEVRYELERRIHARDGRWWRKLLVNPTLRWTIGYGYYPTRAFWWLAGIILSGCVLYSCGYSLGAITPTDKAAYAAFEADRQIPQEYQRFHPLVFAVENSLPFVKLGQVDRWQANPHPQTLLRRVPSSRFGFWTSFAGLLQTYQWIQILSGWILGTLFIAGVTGIIRKE